MQYKKVAKRNTWQWINEGCLGVLQGEYESEIKGSTYHDICKQYRTQGFEENDHFSSLKTALPNVDWHKKFQAVAHSYLETKVKNALWRAIAGKLFLGDIYSNEVSRLQKKTTGYT